MTNGTSDFIIAISVIIGVIVAKVLPQKLALLWRILIAMTLAIILSIIGHLVVKMGESIVDDAVCETAAADGDEASFNVVLEITRDGLLTCNNDFDGKDTDPLILDINNPGFNDYLKIWFDSFTSEQLLYLNNDKALLIFIGPGVPYDLVEKVRNAVTIAGIDQMCVADC